METPYSEDMIYCNCVDNRTQFPCDVETIAALQNNAALTAVIGNIAGCDRVILHGCDGTPRRAGYVWIRSTRQPMAGEILYYPGGGHATSCHIHNEETSVVIDNVPYENAYTRRRIADGTSSSEETYTWASFRRIEDANNGSLTLVKLLEAIKTEKADREAAVSAETAARNAAINALKNNPNYTFVRGMIMMWSGRIAEIPEGWALCDGQGGRPDLRNRFVLGAASDDASGQTYGSHLKPKESGGSWYTQATLELTAADIPAHRHLYSDDAGVEEYLIDAGRGDIKLPPASYQEHGNWSARDHGEGGVYLTGATVFHQSGSTACASTRTSKTLSGIRTAPPFLALAYIIKL